MESRRENKRTKTDHLTSQETHSQIWNRFSHGTAKMASKKNEDRVAVRTKFGNCLTMEYYAVFDGHAGGEVSEYCR